MEEELDTPQSENVEEQVDAVEPQEEVETNEELEKAKSAFNDQKIRAEKAEKELKALKGNKPKEKETPKSNLSGEDVLALVEIPNKEDRDFVVQEAEERRKTVQEIVDNPNTQVILADRVERRRTAEATNTGGSKGFKENQDKELLKKVDQGGEDLSDIDIKRGAELTVEALKTQG